LVSEFLHHKLNSINNTTTSVTEVDATHSRFRGSSPSPGGSHQYSNIINQRNNGGLLITGTCRSFSATVLIIYSITDYT